MFWSCELRRRTPLRVVRSLFCSATLLLSISISIFLPVVIDVLHLLKSIYTLLFLLFAALATHSDTQILILLLFIVFYFSYLGVWTDFI